MSYYSRFYRQRNPHIYDEATKESFFSKQNDSNKPGQKNAFFQAKLSVSQPADPSEQQADAVANAVVNQPFQAAHFGLINRSPATTGSFLPPDISEKIESRSGRGNSLPKNVQQEMGASFGTDFSNVQTHTDRESVNMNQSLHAQAFTHGNDIYFNEGKYNPGSSEGKFLLAHELTHVVQQSISTDGAVQRFGSGDLCPDDSRGIITDSVVQGYIDAALAKAKPSPGDSSNLKNAWLDLTSQRENHCCDANLASAEHYMYARYRIADGWEPYALMVAMIVNYDSWGKYVLPKTGNCPITRPSTGLMKWGLSGATDGMADYYYPRP